MKLHYAEDILETDEKQFISKALKDLIGKCDAGGGDSTNYIETFEQLKEIANSSLSSRLKSLDLKPGCHIKMTEPLEIRFTDYATFNGNGATIETTGLNWGMNVIFGNFCKLNGLRVLCRDVGSYYVDGPELRDFGGIKSALRLNLGNNGIMSDCIIQCSGQLGLYVWSGICHKVKNCIFYQTQVSFSGISGILTDSLFQYSWLVTCVQSGGIDINYVNNVFNSAQIIISGGTDLSFSNNIVYSSLVYTANVPIYSNGKFNRHYFNRSSTSLRFCDNKLDGTYVRIDPILLERALFLNNTGKNDSSFEIMELPYVDGMFGGQNLKPLKYEYSVDPLNHLPKNESRQNVIIENLKAMPIRLYDREFVNRVTIKNSKVFIKPSKEKLTESLGFTTYPNDINYPIEDFSHFSFRFLTEESSEKILKDVSNPNINYPEITKAIFVERKLINDVFLISVYSGPNIGFNTKNGSYEVKNCIRYDFEIPYTKSTLPELNSIIPVETIIGDEFIDMNGVSDSDYEVDRKQYRDDLVIINKRRINNSKIYNYLECSNCHVILFDDLSNPKMTSNADPENLLERSLFFRELIIKDCTIRTYEDVKSGVSSDFLTQPLYIDRYENNTKFVLSNIQLLENCNLLRLRLDKGQNSSVIINNIMNYSDELIENIITMPEGKTIINPMELLSN